jgi:aminopeptidase N
MKSKIKIQTAKPANFFKSPCRLRRNFKIRISIMVKALSLLFAFLILGSGIKAQSSGQFPEVIVLHEKERFRAMNLLDAQSVASADFDVHFYRCEWELDPAVRYIRGMVSPHFTITAATASITFDLSKALMVDSVLYHGAKVLFQQLTTDALQVNFPNTLAPEQKDSLSIFYKGVPPNSGFGSFMQSTHNGAPVLWTLSEPYGAKDWWPCKDMLTDKADSIDISITYPAAYQSSSNGLLVDERLIGDKKQDDWKHRYPIASYLVALAVTNYSIDHDSVQLPYGRLPVEMYAYPEDSASFKTATATAKAGLQLFSELLGNYPFSNERYAQTQFGWGGGMEHQTNSFISAPDAGLVAHELAHQWFGDAVTNGSWQDLWLHEGFATYLAFVYAMSLEGADPQGYLQTWQSGITANPAGSVFTTDTAIGRLFNNRLTYTKGAYVLHMLRWKVGDSLFFRGLRQYLSDPALRFKTARTADLQRNMESASGQALAGFFNDWIYGEGHPTYRGEWSPAGATTVNVKLSQRTSHPSVPFFEMPVPLQFRNATRDTIITVNHTRNDEVFMLNPGFMPDTLIIDPQLRILSKDNIALKPGVITGVPEVPDAVEVVVLPNPAAHTVTVYLPAAPARKTNIRLFSISGQQLFLKTVTASGNEQIAIPVHHLASGLYWVQIARNGVRTITKPIFVKR